MSPPSLGVSHGLRHLAFADPGEVAWQQAIPWSRAGLNDQGKLGLLLQLAALMAHCQDHGLIFGNAQTPLAQARVDARGQLKVEPGRPGRWSDPSQTLLARALLELFDSRQNIQGRGAPRKAARVLLERWRQELIPQRPEYLVAEIFAAAPFLWSPQCALWRLALYAENESPPGSGQWSPSLATTPATRRRWLAAAPGREALWASLTGSAARGLFEGPGPSSETPQQAAQRAYDHGQYRRGLELLAAAPEADAPAGPRLLLRLACQHALGENHAACKTLHQLSHLRQNQALAFADLLQLTELANRLAGSRHDLIAIERQTAELLAASANEPPVERALAALVAAGAAWDAFDADAMDSALAQAALLQDHPRWGWRWGTLVGQRALMSGDGLAAARAFEYALRWRRQLRRAEAGRIFNDLAIARALSGDLARAERACIHAWHLLHRCDGPASYTLALTNLAELRVRRGHFTGVAATLERSMAENRAAANERALLHDLLLAARLELGLGRPLAALARCAAVAELAAGQDHPLAHLLAARALGWLRHTETAAAKLAVGHTALAELEPEERPAVFALAGELEAARREAHGQPVAALWNAVLAGEPPPLQAWQALDPLENYRAARLLYDLETYLPGCSPAFRRAEACQTLRAAGALPFATALEGQPGLLVATALRAYAQEPANLETATRFLQEAGYADSQLRWVDPARLGTESLPVGWPPQVASRALPDGELCLHASRIDPTLESLFALVTRDLAPLATRRHPEPPRKSEQIVGGKNTDENEDPGRIDGIFGKSPALVAALERLDRLAKGELPIFILGESGTGKEAMARRCHRLSLRRQGPFLAINCAALSESLILSDLFGHVRGAFTGADRDRAGLFEAARGGTVFLDEIGDLPLSCQGHLLRVLQESEIRRVGESVSRKVDVRVVTATHRDLHEEVEKGRFRQDLYFRLKVAKIQLPPLRERAGDILHLANHFLAARGNAAARPFLGKKAASALERHDWPGNIRELKNVLEVAIALADGGEITPECLELPTVATQKSDLESALAKNGPKPSESSESSSFHDQLDQFRRRLLTEALEKCGGNRAAAARQLGLTRQALSYLTRQLGIYQ